MVPTMAAWKLALRAPCFKSVHKDGTVFWRWPLAPIASGKCPALVLRKDPSGHLTLWISAHEADLEPKS